MYGGLFGDLPSAKKQKATPSAANYDDAETTDTKECDTNKPTDESSSSSAGAKGDIKTLAAPSAKGNWLAPPRHAATKAATTTTNNKNKSQFLQMVGKSGTTMAFVPAAALKSKRKKVNAVNTNNNNSNVTTEKDNESTKKITLTSSSAEQQQSSFAAVTTTTIVSKTDKKNTTVVVDIHGNSVAETTESNPVSLATTNRMLDASSHPSNEEKITDLYDPYVPNDLLEYWETLAAKKHREKLERDTREALEQQKSMRKQLEEDRKALLQQATMGSNAPLAMGRGRGVSNLPAWLVEKQRTSGVVGIARDEQHDDVPSFRGRGRGVSNLPAWLVEKQRKEAEGQ